MKKISLLVFALLCVSASGQTKIKFLNNTTLYSKDIMPGGNTFQPVGTLSKFDLDQIIPIKNSSEIVGTIFSAKNHLYIRPFLSLIDDDVNELDDVIIPFYTSNGIDELDNQFKDDDAYLEFRKLIKDNRKNYGEVKKLMDNTIENKKNRKYIVALRKTLTDTTQNIAITRKDIVEKEIKASLLANLKLKLSEALGGNVTLDASIGNLVEKEINVDAKLYTVKLTPIYISFLNSKLCAKFNSGSYKNLDTSLPINKTIKDYFDDSSYGIVVASNILEATYSVDKNSDFSTKVLAQIKAKYDLTEDKLNTVEAAISATFKFSKQSEQSVKSKKSLYVLGYSDSINLDIGAGGKTKCL